MDQSQTEIAIDLAPLLKAECDTVRNLLLLRYRVGALLPPLRVFSQASPVERIAVRLDDTLNRIAQGGFASATEETMLTLLSDLVLYRIASKTEASTDTPLHRALADVKDELATAEGALERAVPRMVVKADGERVPGFQPRFAGPVHEHERARVV